MLSQDFNGSGRLGGKITGLEQFLQFHSSVFMAGRRHFLGLTVTTDLSSAIQGDYTSCDYQVGPESGSICFFAGSLFHLYLFSLRIFPRFTRGFFLFSQDSYTDEKIPFGPCLQVGSMKETT
ncbi:hypothetical protein AVEN_43124-1 [Araneus ventricosus]|uniref:Uncharacterized protein n=1 Tax=Araneus ventricosus TaxID=182803 RepID=A0A4Y2V4S0_ARAVE|nr:hypothetical protein AVEN_43124-1 [Araneus ventricosus]